MTFAATTRCGCTECLALDRAHPNEGWQPPLPLTELPCSVCTAEDCIEDEA